MRLYSPRYHRVRQSGIAKKLIAIFSEIAPGGCSEVVYGRLHVTPWNQAGTEGKVLGETAIDGRIADTEHAIGSHAMEPTHYVAEIGTRRTRSRVASRAQGRQSAQSQCSACHACCGIGDTVDLHGLAVGQPRLNTGNLRPIVLGLQFNFGKTVQVGDLEGDCRNLAGVLFRDLLRSIGFERACGDYACISGY